MTSFSKPQPLWLVGYYSYKSWPSKNFLSFDGYHQW